MRYYIVNKKDLSMKIVECDAVERPEDIEARHSGLMVYLAGEDDDWTTTGDLTAVSSMLMTELNELEDKLLCDIDSIRKKRDALVRVNKNDKDSCPAEWMILAKEYQKTI